jgi:quercetin dioxygenase-like cupin family protein
MAHAGQTIEGRDGFSLTLIETAAETGGERLVMEAGYSGEGPLPPVHHHPSQTERFEVLEGAMLTVIGETERRYVAGESFEVPPGTPHQMAADGGPARMRWTVTPALRTAEFFERLHDAMLGEDWDALGPLIEEHQAEVRFG